MYTVGIDTSSPLGSVALLRDGELIAESHARVQAKHGETLLSHLEHVLGEGAIGIRELDLIAIGAGPGSFTGLRVGVATAKGLAFAANIPIVGVNSLQAVACGMPKGLQLVLTDAYKSEVYAAGFGPSVEEAEPWFSLRHGSIADVVSQAAELLNGEAVTVAGSGCRRYAEQLIPALPSAWTLVGEEYDEPHARHVASLGRARFLRDGRDSVSDLEPLYVRPSDAKLPGGVTLVRES